MKKVQSGFLSGDDTSVGNGVAGNCGFQGWAQLLFITLLLDVFLFLIILDISIGYYRFASFVRFSYR